MTIFVILFRNMIWFLYRKFFFLFQRYSAIYNKNTYINSPYVSRDTQIGNYVYIWYNTTITRAIIGNYCSIASHVSIGMGEHDLNQISTNAIFYTNPYEQLTAQDCILGNDVWVGVDSIIRRWVKIGNGAVIGANSFVNSDVPPYAIVAWSPARIIRFRFSERDIALIENSRWWDYSRDEAQKIIQDLTVKLHA